MKKWLLTIACLLFITNFANALSIDKNASKVEFNATKFGFVSVNGEFKDFSGEIVMNNNDITKLNGSIRVDSVFSDNKKRDSHIRGENFFDSANFPQINFVMNKFEVLNKDENKSSGKMQGVLNAHGVDKNVVLDFVLVKEEDYYKLQLNGNVNIKDDFNMASSVIVNNDIKIVVNLVFK